MKNVSAWLSAFLLLCIACFSWGCATKTAPPPEVVEVTPFPRDPIPEELVTNCRSEDLVACDALSEMNAKITALDELHQTQYGELEKILKKIARLIKYKERPPAATVTADQPDTSKWTDPQGKYPSKMVIRIEYKRGLERLATKTDVPKELTAELADLYRKSKKFAKAWDKKVSSARVRLPKELMAKREMGSLKYNLVEKKGTINHIPKKLLDKYIVRNAQPWAAKASHVITEYRLSYKSAKDHEVNILPALTVTRPENGKGSYGISETRAKRERLVLTSMLDAENYCETLRAEMRFYPKGKSPPMKVVFRPVSNRRSSR